MALSQGTVTIDGDGNATGSGAALAVYNALLAEASADFPDPNTPPAGGVQTLNGTTVTVPPWPGTAQEWEDAANASILVCKQGLAKQARGIAALIPYITGNGVVTTTVNAGGLQRLPGTIATGQPTDAPASPVNLTGVIT